MILLHMLVNVSVPFSTSDHNKVEFKLTCYSTVLFHSIEKVFVDYIVVNWDGLNNYLCNVNWSEIYAINDNGDSRWSAFSSILNDAIIPFAPTQLRDELTIMYTRINLFAFFLLQDIKYLQPYLEEVEKEHAERQEWNKK